MLHFTGWNNFSTSIPAFNRCHPKLSEGFHDHCILPLSDFKARGKLIDRQENLDFGYGCRMRGFANLQPLF